MFAAASPPVPESTAAALIRSVRDGAHDGTLVTKIRRWMEISRREDFTKFSEMSMSLSALAAYMVVMILLLFPIFFSAFVAGLDHKKDSAQFGLAAFSIAFATGLVAMHIAVYAHFHNSQYHINNAYQRWLTPRITTLRSVLVVSIIAFASFRMLARTIYGKCGSQAISQAWSCNPDENIQALPPESILLLMAVQVVLVMLFRDVNIAVFLCTWGICAVSVVVCIFLVQAQRSIHTSALYLLVTLFVILEATRHHISLYLVTLKLRDALEENEAMARQTHAAEMRHMIANVAHDLKTPLTSFLSGIEVIADVAVDLDRKTSEGNTTTQYLHDTALSVLNCVNNIRNTNSFMLMTINRCIDYTKASKGLKLVPKHETIDLIETLSLPLNCMKDIQQRVVIHLEPTPSTICSHVITDKQWLQENVLCLLSNAVKYSSGGDVTIALYLLPSSHRNSKITKKPASMRHTLLSMPSDAQVHPSLDEVVAMDIVKEYPSARSYAPAELFDEPEGSACGEELESPGAYLRIEVEDTGIGLSEDAMANLFNPFKQAQRLAGGTGLGLYSLARRLEALNGFYGVDHRRDGEQGSMFWFSIPYRPDRVSASSRSMRRSMFPRRNEGWLSTIVGSRENSDGSPLDSGSGGSGGSMDLSTAGQLVVVPDCLAPAAVSIHHRTLDPYEGSAKGVQLDILVVDDSPAIVKMTSMMLRRFGHNTTIAEHGDAALKVIWQRLEHIRRPFDVVLMDLQMPVMDGLEATRRLRTYESLPQTHTPSSVSSPSRSLRGRAPKAMSERVEASRSSFNSDPDFAGGSPRTPESRNAMHQFVIGVSANSDHDTMQEALAAGVDAFMAKPFTMETFYDTYEKIKTAQGSGHG